VPQTLNGQVVDEWVRIGDAESFHTARELARREGLLVGGSSGTAVAAALRYARRLADADVVVALCADTGRNYQSKFLRRRLAGREPPALGAPPPAQDPRRPAAPARPPALVTVGGPETTAAQAVELMQATGDLAAARPARGASPSGASRR
jgi:cystathionine beta-synthase